MKPYKQPNPFKEQEIYTVATKVRKAIISSYDFPKDRFRWIPFFKALIKIFTK